MLKGKKAIIVAAVGKAVKTGGIVWLVDKYGNELNTFINKLTAKYPVSDSYATKVVPIIAVGTKGYVGAAQISGPRALVDKCSVGAGRGFSEPIIPCTGIDTGRFD